MGKEVQPPTFKRREEDLQFNTWKDGIDSDSDRERYNRSLSRKRIAKIKICEFKNYINSRNENFRFFLRKLFTVLRAHVNARPSIIIKIEW